MTNQTKSRVTLVIINLILTHSLIATAQNSFEHENTLTKIDAVIAEHSLEQKRLQSLSPEDLIIEADTILADLNQQIDQIGHNTDSSNGKLTQLGQQSFIVEKKIEEMYQLLNKHYQGDLTYIQAQKQMSEILRLLLHIQNK